MFKERNLWCLSQRQGDGVSKGESCNASLWSPLSAVYPRRQNKTRKQSRSLAAELLNTAQYLENCIKVHIKIATEPT